MMRAKHAIGCEVAHYTARRVGDDAFHDQVMGSSHLDERIHSLNGSPLYLGQQLAGLQPDSWSIAAPLNVHYNRFAMFHEDLKVSRLREAALWCSYYEPAGIEDQLRGLFYAEGEFLGYVAAFRGDHDAFDEKDRSRLNRAAGAIRNDLLLARSLEREASSEASCHMVCDADGSILYASEAANVWLDAERIAELRTALLFGDIPVVDGMRLAVEILEPHGWHYVSLWSAAPVRHRRTRGLTRRQRSIGRLASRGLSNAEVAEVLGVSNSTVKYHLRQVFQTLGVQSRRELRGIGW